VTARRYVDEKEKKLTEEFERWLQDRLAETAASADRAPGPVRVTPPLAEWEARYLDQALRDGLFAADGAGSITSELLEPQSAETRYPIYSKTPPYRLLRENIGQLAAAAWLIYRRGWLPSHLILQPSKAEHRSIGGFDLLVKSAAGQNLIWVETKRSAAEVEKLIADLRACGRRGRHARAECGFPQNHPRYEFCLEARPEFLWSVAPDGDYAFALRFGEAAPQLEALESLPPRSFFEHR
jgi:hypothetical protein